MVTPQSSSGSGERSYRWGPVQELIFLDRYSPKGPRESIAAGDVVVVMTSDDPKHPAKEVGVVQAVDGDELTIELRYTGEVIRRHRRLCDKPLELGPEQMWDRMASAIVAVEPAQRREELRRQFRWLLEGFRFVPGGRINAMLGTGQKLTAYNCYTIPLRGRTPQTPGDSRHGIIDTLGNMVEIMARGGGVGINLSVLRPRLAYVKGVNGKSSGAVSWGALFSFATGLVEQGGSRRGALMLILNVWHPDVLEFINAKRDFRAITNANISVGITDEFEQALAEDGDWELVFPDTADPDYDQLWDGDLKRWKAMGKPVVVYRRLKARELWRQIVEAAWASAEPGIVRLDYCNRMSNSWYFAPLIATNPCAEQPLPAWGVCLLGHLNLARFVTDSGEVLWDELGRAARLGVRFLDNVIDITPYFFEDNERQQKRERRIGMGTMGLAEMLIRLGIRYGSPESLEFIDKLYGFIAREAYLASVELAREKGPFPAFDAEKFLMSGFMRSMPEDVREQVRRYGIRNVTLLTQAPTGTTGTMVGTSTGIEPYYAWSYYRFGRLGRKEIVEPVVEEWFARHPEAGRDFKNLPPYFVTALELTPEEHVRVQAAIQRWVDAALSKTANLPAHYTVEQTMALYDLAVKLGCKGVTIYRDRSRDEQVLMVKEQSGTPAAEEGSSRPDGQVSAAAAGASHAGTTPSAQGAGASAATPAGTTPSYVAAVAGGAQAPVGTPSGNGQDGLHVEPRAVIGEVPEEVVGITYRQKTMVGTARVVVNEYPPGQPFETIIVLGKGGMDITADAEAIGRLISLYLRTPSPISNLEKLALVVEQLRNIGGAQPFGFGPNKVLSMPDALAKALERYLMTRLGKRSGSPGHPDFPDSPRAGQPGTFGSSGERESSERRGSEAAGGGATSSAPGDGYPVSEGPGIGGGRAVEEQPDARRVRPAGALAERVLPVEAGQVDKRERDAGEERRAHVPEPAPAGSASPAPAGPSAGNPTTGGAAGDATPAATFGHLGRERANGSHAVLTGADICPMCGQAQYVRVEGCGFCHNCGYTRC